MGGEVAREGKLLHHHVEHSSRRQRFSRAGRGLQPAEFRLAVTSRGSGGA